MFKSLGWPEIILILVILFIFFGVGKLPQVGEAVGKAIRSFKKAASTEPFAQEPPVTSTTTTRTKKIAQKRTS